MDEKKQERGILDANESLTERLRKINELGRFNENERKSLRERAQEKRDAIKELSEQMAEETLERLSSGDGASFAAHFRSIGRLLGKYSKTNQQLIEAQRPNTLGVASKGAWERRGYVVSGEPVEISQSSTFLKHGDAAVERWLIENPLREVYAWYRGTKPFKEGKSFAEFALSVAKTSDTPEGKRLAGEIESHIKRFSKTDNPTPEDRRLALDFYTGSKVGLVVSGTTHTESAEETAAKQRAAEDAHWFMRPPFGASRSLVAFCATIYAERCGQNPASRTTEDKEQMKASFTKRYKKWANENYMRDHIADSYRRLLAAQAENKKNGVETPESDRVSFFPIVSFPYMGHVFAYEDVTPGEKAKAPPITVKIECDEELYGAVKTLFSGEFEIQETEETLGAGEKDYHKGVRVSLSDSPGVRVLDIVRSWSGKKTSGMGQDAHVFREMTALAIMSSIGLDNPYAESLAIREFNREELSKGLEFAYSNISDLLVKLRRNIGPLVEEKIVHAMSEIRAAETARTTDEAEEGGEQADAGGTMAVAEPAEPAPEDFMNLSF